MPPANPIARAYFRSLEKMTIAHTAPPAAPSPSPSKTRPPSADPPEAAAALFDILLDAGIIAQPPRALLSGSQDQPAPPPAHPGANAIRVRLQPRAYARRNDELTYLANTLMAGCALQGRPFTTQEAWDAAVAVCNLGLQSWPPLWIQRSHCPMTFSSPTISSTVFQVGWTVLHKDVGIYAARAAPGSARRFAGC